MAMSFGMAKGRGHSHGGLGHGGEHMKGGSVTAHGSHGPSSNPHSMDPGGHTTSNEHGGGFPMGCG
jgi:hypothetical protein